MKRNYSYVLDLNGDIFYCRTAIDNDTMNEIIDIYDVDEEYVGSIDGDVGIPDASERKDDTESYMCAVERLETAVENLLNS